MYIGIIGRKNDDKITFNKEIIDVIKKYGFTPLGIIVDFKKENEFIKVKPLIDLCSCFILQGGSDYYDIDIEITKYLHQKNIPTLGICLGMQTMAMAFNGIMADIDNHKSDKLYVHEVNIDKNSKLYNIIKKDNIMVNSRHKSYIINTDLKVSGKANIIEAIEDTDKYFFIGVQWHPETLMDESSILLFNNFFSSAKYQKN